LLVSERTPVASAFFDPCADRARRLDARMRHRLAESLRYVAEQCAARCPFPSGEFEAFLARLAAGPVSPHAFAAYYDLVLALEDDDLAEAQRHLRQMLSAPPPGDRLRIVELGDAASDPDWDRVRRHVDTDATLPLEILPPPPEAAARSRRLIQAALALIEAGSPELASEIRALVREIVLAVGPSGAGTLTFDGASSFMLWGAVVLNAAGHATPLEMVQALAHESAHNLLFGLAADGPLVENDDAERFASPLRLDPRPIDGIFHATFVTARMHQAVARLLAAEQLEPGDAAEARRALEANAAHFAQGLATLDRVARLTPMGRAALEGARAYMGAGMSRASSPFGAS
jgi:HEXXH motif-containing protein